MFNDLLLKLILTPVCSAQVLSGDVKTGQDGIEQKFLSKSGFSADISLGDIAYKVIAGFLSLLSIIFIILIIYAGYNWMTAAGDEAKVEKAKDTILRAIIGLIITLAAYSITYFVFTYVPFGGSGGGGGTISQPMPGQG